MFCYIFLKKKNSATGAPKPGMFFFVVVLRSKCIKACYLLKISPIFWKSNLRTTHSEWSLMALTYVQYIPIVVVDVPMLGLLSEAVRKQSLLLFLPAASPRLTFQVFMLVKAGITQKCPRERWMEGQCSGQSEQMQPHCREAKTEPKQTGRSHMRAIKWMSALYVHPNILYLSSSTGSCISTQGLFKRLRQHRMFLPSLIDHIEEKSVERVIAPCCLRWLPQERVQYSTDRRPMTTAACHVFVWKTWNLDWTCQEHFG